eukprot:CAMPEP_0183523788 /NCGR_PEP_ID=MMETSP0371-20130417/19426_1 /TAXON_ID=268820 /ORGANISM="Peridinium aciculiferum, Strain PAER-2" /LENGTH=312 /DNA_ID=CAMNT_0025722791 /DNA_START=47 /DNA_END=985 /DNA_ORIENTATION=-
MAVLKWTQRLLLAALCGEISGQGHGHVDQCPGNVNVIGRGNTTLIATKVNMPNFPAGPVDNMNGIVMPGMWGRAYFADECRNGMYDNNQYASIPLLGKKFTYNTDVSQAGCGCNAALYLVSMRQNIEVSGCDDYYCDANSICGVRCDEIDIQEANKFAWHSALHRFDDGNGLATGLGGWVRDNHFEMTPSEYGPGGQCIDTNSLFKVEVSFPANDQGRLISMDMKLSQYGKLCDISWSIDSYSGDPGLEHLSNSLAEGMTPVISYWEAADMLWLDGRGNGGGPCFRDDMDCGTAPLFSGFAIEDLDASTFYP